MTKYREIIRLTGLGFSQRNIMASCGVSQKTVVKVQKRVRELNISWPLNDSMTDTELQRLMFSKESKVSANKRMPDYDYIRKELLRNGVSKKLLWTEYMEDCRANGEEPLMYGLPWSTGFKISNVGASGLGASELPAQVMGLRRLISLSIASTNVACW